MRKAQNKHKNIYYYRVYLILHLCYNILYIYIIIIFIIIIISEVIINKKKMK